MSGITIDQMAGVQSEAQDTHEGDIQETAPAGHGFSFDFGFFKTQTGDGDIESYMNHPLNFDGKKSTGRILRGATGLFGSLNFALADIMIGIMEMAKERRNG